MTRGPWNLFPYPTLTFKGDLTDGSVLNAHPDCVSCATRECLSDSKSDVAEPRFCRYGMTYMRVDEERVVVGVVANDLVNASMRARRRARQEPDRRTITKTLKHAVDMARGVGIGVTFDFESAKAEMLSRLESDPKLHEALAEHLRRDFSENLQQSHDFLQLVKLVRGHAESLLHDKYPSLGPPDAADKMPTEGAIYYSTELMLAKMDSMVFLNEINIAHGNERKFKIHPLILKYVRIYDWQAREKDLKIRLDCNSYSSSYYNDKAIGAVVQGLLDNLVKYAPGGSSATVSFGETDHNVQVSFSSLGPKIAEDERNRIFLPKYRARAAMEMEMSGLGIGLATAKQISDALGLGLDVQQDADPDPRFVGVFRTTFELRLEKSI